MSSRIFSTTLRCARDASPIPTLALSATTTITGGTSCSFRLSSSRDSARSYRALASWLGPCSSDWTSFCAPARKAAKERKGKGHGEENNEEEDCCHRRRGKKKKGGGRKKQERDWQMHSVCNAFMHPAYCIERGNRDAPAPTASSAWAGCSPGTHPRPRLARE